jgi:uncharacterized tellurite resistance protein B-like protein
MVITDKLRNLLVMAASDGSLTEREIRYLMDRCQKWGVPDSLVAEAIQYALSPDAALAIPPRPAERREMLKDLITMMAADGDLAETERNLFAVAAAKMGVSVSELNELIDKITRTNPS